MPLARRGPAIEQALAAAFDTDAIAAAVARHRDRARPLVVACNLLWLWLFAAAPAVLAWRGLAGSWRALLVGMLLLAGWTTVEFWLAHRELYAERRTERWLAAVGFLCAPPSAVRACDRLSRDLLADRDPVAVAAVLCERSAALKLAELALRDARHPLPPVCPGDDPTAQRAESWFRARRLTAIERAIERRFGASALDLASGTPATLAPESAVYCPRCTSEYIVEAAECIDCPGIALAPARPAVSPRPRPASGPPPARARRRRHRRRRPEAP
jgi:hypothetical protein